MSNPYEAPQTLTPANSAKATFSYWKFFSRTGAILGGLFILLFLLLPLRRGPREAGPRIRCGNNLKQLGLALHNYHDTYGAFPPAYTVDADGKPLHSWRTLILPFMEQQQLYSQIDLSKPWDDSVNQEAFQNTSSLMRCPAATSVKNGHTTYLAVVAPGSFFDPTQPRQLTDVTDDHSQTLMIIEVDVAHSVPWMSPQDADEALMLEVLQSHALPHSRGIQAARVDGSVMLISKDIDPKTLRAMITIAGGDDPADEDASP